MSSNSNNAGTTILIFAGQSNLVGRGDPKDLPSIMNDGDFELLNSAGQMGELMLSFDHDLNFGEDNWSKSDGWVPFTPAAQNSKLTQRGSHFGPEVAVAAQFLRAMNLGSNKDPQCESHISSPEPRAALGLIKFGMGSTSLYSDWRPISGDSSTEKTSANSSEAAPPPLPMPPSTSGSSRLDRLGLRNKRCTYAPEGHFERFVAFVEEALRLIHTTAALPQPVRLGGLFWFQGEGDSGGNAAAKRAYGANLEAFYRAARARLLPLFHHPAAATAPPLSLPFVAQHIFWHEKSKSRARDSAKINAQMSDACARLEEEAQARGGRQDEGFLLASENKPVFSKVKSNKDAKHQSKHRSLVACSTQADALFERRRIDDAVKQRNAAAPLHELTNLSTEITCLFASSSDMTVFPDAHLDSASLVAIGYAMASKAAALGSGPFSTFLHGRGEGPKDGNLLFAQRGLTPPASENCVPSESGPLRCPVVLLEQTAKFSVWAFRNA